MGILDDAEVSGNEIPKDPFGFGNDLWPVAVLSFTRPKPSDQLSEEDQQKLISERPYADISSSGKQYGGMLCFRILDERYQYLGANNPNQMPGQLGRGQWFQLPSPKWAREQVPFDKNSPEGKKIIHAWSSLCFAAGIPIDKISAADIPDIIGKTMVAKIYPKENENGFYEFRVAGWKPMPKEGSPEGIGEFTKSGTSNPGTSAMSEMEKAMLEEQQNA
jgi:hypothetical protein